MVDEQHQSDDAALRDGGALVDVVDAEGNIAVPSMIMAMRRGVNRASTRWIFVAAFVLT